MTKKQNTFVFILVGTVVSIILTLVLGVVLFLITYMILKNDMELFAVIVPFTVVLALFLSIFIYQKLVMVVITKFHLEDKLDPLFTKKNKNKKKYQ